MVTLKKMFQQERKSMQQAQLHILQSIQEVKRREDDWKLFIACIYKNEITTKGIIRQRNALIF
jgi:hypothetical protein